MLPGREPDQSDHPARRANPERLAPGDRRAAATVADGREPAAEYHHCPECAGERRFERPECLDGHGSDCPELACVHCGTAILVAPLTQLGAGPDDEAWWPRLVRQAAPGREPDASSRGGSPARSLASAGRAPRSRA
ncbi:hypothetical protein [Pseudofrankia asymbiotica]|uniref:Uncharacterized protein n=1 Tax=Pseudofrankia asymbiotica TaxID=1834516 RepID=A0A1V2IC20_9ACTN|nr:hypothetical protein [Pseudofrankia asymbiotica]ONH30429.1 hypothetical protein BL253_13905 [Pseudofrankia asymbiotica]